MSNTIHVRLHPDDAAIEPAYCGERGCTTITAPVGYYGEGRGRYEVCPACRAAWKAGKPVPARETREEALARFFPRLHPKP